MRDNEQAPEKRVHLSELALRHGHIDVHSIFYTIQGEGPFAGTPAVFIRLAGCNLQCPKCDTDYTSKRQWLDVEELCHRVRSASQVAKLVVITGGEPFRQDISKLALRLITKGHYVQVETNGTLPPPVDIAAANTETHERRGLYIVCSPKAGKVHPFTSDIACAYKYVMSANSVDPLDGLPVYALDHSLGPLRVARPPKDFEGPVYLQPMDEQDADANIMHQQACIKSCMQHGYILQLQIHKLIGME